uniref:Uncharacterized protein n=1 Tax=Octopus bimaculoides TaxID=37653 RepID=A0A0L8FFX7_OCTBM
MKIYVTLAFLEFYMRPLFLVEVSPNPHNIPDHSLFDFFLVLLLFKTKIIFFLTFSISLFIHHFSIFHILAT